MENLPAELRLLVVERTSPVEKLANFRLVSRAWRDSVDRSLIRNWVQQLLAGKQFAASLDAGLHIVQHHVNVFVDDGISVVLRVAKSGPSAWLTLRFEGPRPKCQRWTCETCQEDDYETSTSSKPCLVLQTQGVFGWENWFSTELGAEALLVVQQELPRIKQRMPFSDCGAASQVA